MVSLIKPQALRKGDTIALISPSAGMANLVPHRVENAKNMLESMGFAVLFGKHALGRSHWVSGTVQERVYDIHAAFSDPSVRAIVSMIGGNHCNQLLNHLDYGIIAKNPKIVVGYSDITVLHHALYTKAGLTTFYGPAALTQFAEYPLLQQYTQNWFEKALMSTEPLGDIQPSMEWTEEILDWTKKKDLERARTMKPNEGYISLRPGSGNGHLVGGCITSMMHTLNTEYWPQTGGSIFFIETPEGEDFTKGEPVDSIDSALTDLSNAGIFKDIAGLIVGRPFGYTDEQEKQFRQSILSHTKGATYPILYNVNIGHADPILTIPYGVKARISNDGLTVTESGVSPHT